MNALLSICFYIILIERKGVYTFLAKNHFFFTKKNELVRGRGEGNALPMDVLYTIKCCNFYLSNQK
jgi:hypothetical protein